MKWKRKHLVISHTWMGSMIFDEILQARAKRVVEEYNSIIRRRACWAAGVILQFINLPLHSKTYLSASSRITSLWWPSGRITFFWANILIFSRTTSIPLEDEMVKGRNTGHPRHSTQWPQSCRNHRAWPSPNTWYLSSFRYLEVPRVKEKQT